MLGKVLFADSNTCAARVKRSMEAPMVTKPVAGSSGVITSGISTRTVTCRGSSVFREAQGKEAGEWGNLQQLKQSSLHSRV